jgi:hypothetical protein
MMGCLARHGLERAEDAFGVLLMVPFGVIGNPRQSLSWTQRSIERCLFQAFVRNGNFLLMVHFISNLSQKYALQLVRWGLLAK